MVGCRSGGGARKGCGVDWCLVLSAKGSLFGG